MPLQHPSPLSAPHHKHMLPIRECVFHHSAQIIAMDQSRHRGWPTQAPLKCEVKQVQLTLPLAGMGLAYMSSWFTQAFDRVFLPWWFLAGFWPVALIVVHLSDGFLTCGLLVLTKRALAHITERTS